MAAITDPTEEYFKDGVWGWDGSQWRKLPLLFGYSDRYAERVGPVTAVSGTNQLDLSTVPSGEIWVITSISAWASSSNISRVDLRVIVGSDVFVLKATGYSTAYHTVDWQGTIILAAGDYIRVQFSGASGGEALDAWAVGYKMKIAE